METPTPDPDAPSPQSPEARNSPAKSRHRAAWWRWMRTGVTHGYVTLLVVAKGALVLLRRPLRGPKHAQWSVAFELVVEGARVIFAVGAERDVHTIRSFPRVPLVPALRATVAWRRTVLAGLSAEEHVARGYPSSRHVVLYLHGGGYLAFSPATHRNLIAQLATHTRCRVIAPDYPKAPEHPFPAPIDACELAYDALLAEGVAPERVLLAGDSAGGGLVLALLQRLRDRGDSVPAAAYLMSPWTDMGARGGSLESNAAFDYLQAPMLDMGREMYLGQHPADDPLASPLHADLRGLPPLLVHVGGAEIFHDQNVELIRRAEAAGVQVQARVFDGMPHVFPFLSAVSRDGRDAIREAGEFLRQHGSPPPSAQSHS